MKICKSLSTYLCQNVQEVGGLLRSKAAFPWYAVCRRSERAGIRLHRTLYVQEQMIGNVMCIIVLQYSQLIAKLWMTTERFARRKLHMIFFTNRWHSNWHLNVMPILLWIALEILRRKTFCTWSEICLQIKNSHCLQLHYDLKFTIWAARWLVWGVYKFIGFAVFITLVILNTCSVLCVIQSYPRAWPFLYLILFYTKS